MESSKLHNTAELYSVAAELHVSLEFKRLRFIEQNRTNLHQHRGKKLSKMCSFTKFLLFKSRKNVVRPFFTFSCWTEALQKWSQWITITLWCVTSPDTPRCELAAHHICWGFSGICVNKYCLLVRGTAGIQLNMEFMCMPCEISEYLHHSFDRKIGWMTDSTYIIQYCGCFGSCKYHRQVIIAASELELGILERMLGGTC